MNVDDIALELRVNGQIFPRLDEVDGPDRVMEARRLLREAGRKIGVRVQAREQPDEQRVLGWIDDRNEREPRHVQEAADAVDFGNEAED